MAKKAVNRDAPGPKKKVKTVKKAKKAKKTEVVPKKAKASSSGRGGGSVESEARSASAAKPKKTVKKAAKPLKAQRPKTPLSKGELAEFRRMLLEKRRSLIGDMDGMTNEALRRNVSGRSGDLSSIPTHKADIGTDNYEQEFTLGLLESEQAMLAEIEEALARINNGTYGICFGTGKPIGKPRLRARPWAKYCIEYARLIEKGLVRPQLDDDEELFADTDGGKLKADDEDEIGEEEESDTESEDDLGGEDEDSKGGA